MELRKAWIRASRNNMWIVRSFRGAHRPKGAKRGFMQSMDSCNPWIEANEACIRRSCGSFTKGARSRYSQAVLAVHEKRRVARACARTRNRKYAVYLVYTTFRENFSHSAYIVTTDRYRRSPLLDYVSSLHSRSSSVVRTYP